MGPQNFTNNSSNKKDFLILQVVVKTVSLFIHFFFQPLKLCHEGTTNKIQVICKISCIYCKKLNFSAVNTVQYQAQAFS